MEKSKPTVNYINFVYAMMFVRTANLGRGLCENLPVVWIVSGPHRHAPVYTSLARQKATGTGRTAKHVDARYTWCDLDAFSHKSERFRCPASVVYILMGEPMRP